MSSELRARLGVAVVGAPLVLLAAYRGGWLFGALLSLVAALAAWEFRELANQPSGPPHRWLGIVAAPLLVLLATREANFSLWADQAFVLLLVLGLVSFAAAVLEGKVERALASAAVTVAGTLYTGGTLAFAVFIRSLPEVRGSLPSQAAEGFLLVLLPLLVTWTGDTAAYFAGRRFGRRRLAPRVSPGKTVEGGVAGLAGALAIGFGMGFLLGHQPNFPVAPPAGAMIGLCLGVAGQVGDLVESRLKREAGVKDSGRLLPGHGGVLDRLDGLFLAIPLAYGLIVMKGIWP